MKIERGKLYVNKTWRFLVPCLRGYGDIFINKFNSLSKLAAGIDDDFFTKSSLTEPTIFILFDKNYNPISFTNFLYWIRQQNYYIADYIYDADIKNYSQHMIVLKIPEFFTLSYKYFLKGEYSKMYGKENLKILFSSPKRKRELLILKKDKSIFKRYCKIMKKEFGTDIRFSNKIKEFELPLKTEEEIFNNMSDKIFI